MDLSTVNQSASPQAKIGLFRALFRGREDVYPRRFENRRTGKAGYALACANEWVRGICEKPRIKCAECPHRRFLPVTDDVIRWHLSGRDDSGQPFVAGVYPLLQDETCFFLAVDFDKGAWRDDAAAFLDTCRRLNLPAALERSRSGRGAHVWLFFAEAVPAALARRLGSHILTETMEGRPDVGLDSYDRLFPNQDTLPQGGLLACSFKPLVRHRRTPMVRTVREVQPKRSSIGVWKHCPRPKAASGSTPSCQLLSTVSGAWKWIFSARMREWRWRSMARSTFRIRSRIDATGGRIACCRSMTISCCGSSPRTSAKSWT